MKNLKTIALIAAMAIIAPIPATAQINSTPSIEQSAKAERKVTPDEIYIKITINEKDSKGKTTVEQQQAVMIKELGRLGIDVEKDLTLNFMGSEISYTTFRRNIVPRTTATYILKLSNADTMQKVINSLETNGITNIELAGTKYSKPDEIYNELAIEAVKKAQQQASALAEAVGQSIGDAISINSWNSTNSDVQPRLYKARSIAVEDNAESGSAIEPVIEIGKLTYTVNVNAKFILNGKKQ